MKPREARGKPGLHNLRLDNRREAFRVARAMGPTLSAVRLSAISITEGLWPVEMQLSEPDLRQINARLNPPSLELHAYLGNLGNATAEVMITPVPVGPLSVDPAIEVA